MTRPFPLPPRRHQLTGTVAVEPGGMPVHVSVGFGEDGVVREVFARSASPAGSELDLILDDLAVVISHGLQQGLELGALARSVGRQGQYPTIGGRLAVDPLDLSPASVVGGILDAAIALAEEIHHRGAEARSPEEVTETTEETQRAQSIHAPGPLGDLCAPSVSSVIPSLSCRPAAGEGIGL